MAKILKRWMTNKKQGASPYKRYTLGISPRYSGLDLYHKMLKEKELKDAKIEQSSNSERNK